ncbi:transglutaminase-like cysteine peptidase [Nitrincola tapanii]|uniref:Transglutaminase n=1 Tax=Nitrincola tapanii TaxID=1708751 RepID=A0A5A9W3J4_9GAMM|nr:transglutaminase-like cysteine peptidase [Nitrincola tapanii]KAA0875182.1 transglutaminase [Nitrincola tapanii]
MRLTKALGMSWLLVLISIFFLFSTGTATSRVSVDFARFQQLMESRYGGQKAQVARAWEAMLREIANLPDEQKVVRVNQFVHQNVRYRTDIRLWGVEDYWATPMETFGKGFGDCEDYAIAKYISLRQAGISDQNLRLIYVRARTGGARSSVTEAHMVLGYYATPTSEPLILDSLISNVLPASQRPDLSPVFSFNSQGLWAGNAVNPQASSTARLSRWRDVLDRIQQEGVSW